MGKIADWVINFFKSASLVDKSAEPLVYYGDPYDSYSPTTVYRGGSNSDGSKFHRGLSSTGSSPIINNRITMLNARSAYHDSPPARAMIDRFADTVIGSGLRWNPTPRYETLGMTAEQSEEWADKARVSFDIWASNKKVTIDESLNLYQSMRLMEIAQQRDNDYFVRFHYSNRKDLLNPLQISFIDPLQVRGCGITSTRGYQYFGDGINRDANGKEVSYNVSVRNEVKNTYDNVTVPAVGARSGKRMMIHCFRPDYAGQGRGISRIGHILQEFENFTDFSLSQIIKAINQSNITMYVKPSKDAPASNVFDSVTHTRPSGPYGADPTVPADAQQVGEAALPLDQYVKYLDIQEATLREPGSAGVFALQEGEDLAPFGNTSPSENYNTFVDAFVSYLAASCSMPIEILLGKFNSNYSASRAAIIMFWRVAEIWRRDMKADFLDYVAEAWMDGEISRGRISAPGWRDPMIRANWMHNSWLGDPIPNIDPLVTAKAYEMQIRQGSTTLDAIARDTNGSSGSANRLQLAREFAELPVPPWDQKQPIQEKQEENKDEKDDKGNRKGYNE
jgi:capsid protein